jgi:hypothetical protein
MAATYPGVVRPFTTKVNITMDIDSSHVNDLQDEVAAVETILGVNPHYDIGLFTSGVVQNRGTVSNRIKGAEAGTDKPFVSVGYVGSANSWGTSETTIPWSSQISDTHDAWTSGSHITIPRDGYYTLIATSLMAASSVAISSAAAYLMRIFIIASGVTAEASGAEVCYPPNAAPDVRLNVSWAGGLHKGDQAYVNFLNGSGVNRTLSRAVFQAIFLRGL